MSDVDVEIAAWVKVGDTSRIDYEMYPDGQVEFSVGGHDGFVLATSEPSLQNLIVRAEEALQVVRGAITGNDKGSTPV